MRPSGRRGTYVVSQTAAHMSFDSYERYDAVSLAELVRKGEVTPTELVEAAVERIESRNPVVNAVIHRLYDQARTEAQGPLPDGPFRGVPFLVKDLSAEVSGAPMNGGSRFNTGFLPSFDSELVRRFRKAGFIIVGKTNTPEFGITPTTEPVLHGPTRNPWDLSRTSGGSSGGSAAGVATGMVPVAHGGDGGGSIRIPASCCGLFGLKPTRGRNPLGPTRGPHWQGATVDHVISRSVRDSAHVLDATHGPDPGAPYVAPPPTRPYAEEVGRDPGRLRIAFTTHPFLARSVDPACVTAVERTAALLSSLGHEVVEARPDIDGEIFSRSFLTVVASEVAADVAEATFSHGREPRWEDLEPTTWALALLGRAIKAVDLAAAVRSIHLQTRKVGVFFENHDILMTPTLGAPPIPLGTIRATNVEVNLARLMRTLRGGRLMMATDAVGQMAERAFDFAAFTPIFNSTGQPAMSVPLHWTEDGLPVGVHFVGPFGDEGMLFRLAGQLESERPWSGHRPVLNPS